MFWRTKPKPNPVETQSSRLLGEHAAPLIEEMFANTKPKTTSATDKTSLISTWPPSKPM
jgi:hypothetical protein